MKHRDYDVVVIGGGHAGCEAAHAAARVGAETLLITLSTADIGVMSCNPAIGGLGKGHLVREIDALDGVMGVVADKAGIQFRLLNRRKGPAVQGPRAQADRALYRDSMQVLISSQPRLSVLEGEVVDLAQVGQRVSGVVLADGSHIATTSVVLTSGTFLRGVIHIGDKTIRGGRMGDKPSDALGKRLESLNLPMGRLKTGTPPRLNGKTIDWASLDRQEADKEPELFSFLHDRSFAKQIACGITQTNSRTHEIIRENLGRSAMYGGHIEGIGPRYCPSIEDKVVRFADKDSHQIFLEPEGLTDDTIYPNGISTSLPIEVQQDYVRSIKGLEKVEILQPGYAIEYDFVDPRSLDLRLQLKALSGLFLAGQINGTTGYEEAAAQGLVAGVNAASEALGRDPVVFDRSTSYIGVMIDDLTVRGVSEPYRMFTSRAEFRLSLRADNADQRLTGVGYGIGIVSDVRWARFGQKMELIEAGKAMLSRTIATSRSLHDAGVRVNPDGPKRTLLDALSISGTTYEQLADIEPTIAKIDRSTGKQIARDALYSHYIERQRADVEALDRDSRKAIPLSIDYGKIVGLSKELSSKLTLANPDNIAQASRIDGMTPAALLLIIAESRRIELSMAS